MARKGWDQLSDAYRKRLEKGGISKTAYEGGASIKKARGHSKTPERPIGYSPKQFPQYAQKRGSLERQVQQRKEELFGDSPRWNSQKSLRHIRERPPTLAKLRWMLDASPEDIWDAIRQEPEENHFLTYH